MNIRLKKYKNFVQMENEPKFLPILSLEMFEGVVFFKKREIALIFRV